MAHTPIVNVGYHATNYYVIGGSTTRLLVDAGWPDSLPALLAQLKRRDIALQQISHLLVTHYHPDHAGLAQELKARGVRLLVLETQLAAIPLLRGLIKPEVPYLPITLADCLTISCAESRPLLRGIGLAGEIISTPGHSDDSVTLVLDDGAAFTGDLTSPAIDPDNAQVVQSWQAIRGLGATRIYPGHGPAPVPLR
jgi:ribonuclease/clavin/mitogillin